METAKMKDFSVQWLPKDFPLDITILTPQALLQKKGSGPEESQVGGLKVSQCHVSKIALAVNVRKGVFSLATPWVWVMIEINLAMKVTLVN